MAKTELIHVRVTPEVREQIARAAAAARRTVSDWCSIAFEDALAAAKPSRKNKGHR